MIQDLFNTGRCYCYGHDHNFSRTVLHRVLMRLESEHGYQIEKMVQKGYIEIDRQKFTIEFSEDFFAKMIHNVAKMWVTAKGKENNIKNHQIIDKI